METKRKKISQKIRFTVFKRDKFTCQYCGRTPQEGVILQVDHIIPVSKGGGDEIINLTTSCFDCNSGKGATLSSAEHKKVEDISGLLKQELAKKKELENQLKEYYKYKTTLDKYNPIHNFINNTLSKEVNFTLTDVGMKNFEKLYNKSTMEDFIEAISIAKRKFNLDIVESDDQTKKIEVDSGIILKYICGILHNKYREKTDPFYKDEREVMLYYQRHPQKRGGNFYTTWKIKPYIQELGVERVKQAIDEVFNNGYRSGGYFSSVLEYLEQNK